MQDEQPWQLAKDEAEADQLDQVLYTLAEGLRVVSVLLQPFMPGVGGAAARRPRREDLVARRARLGAVAGGAPVGELGQLFPQGRAAEAAGRLGPAVIDTHCHLDTASRPRPSWSERARAAGVERIATVGMNGASIEPRSRRREDHDEVVAIVGRHPHEAAGFDEHALEEIERAAAHPRVRRSARRASTTSATTPRATTSGAPSRHSSSWPRGSNCPSSIHTRAAEDDTFALLREHAGRCPP